MKERMRPGNEVYASIFIWDTKFNVLILAQQLNLTNLKNL